MTKTLSNGKSQKLRSIANEVFSYLLLPNWLDAVLVIALWEWDPNNQRNMYMPSLKTQSQLQDHKLHFNPRRPKLFPHGNKHCSCVLKLRLQVYQAKTFWSKLVDIESSSHHVMVVKINISSIKTTWLLVCILEVLWPHASEWCFEIRKSIMTI